MSEIEKKQQTALTVNRKARGFEEDEQEDLIMPRAKLLQKTSPEVEEGLKFGDIINNITKEKLPERFVPVFKQKYFVKFGDDRKMLWKTFSPDSEQLEETRFGENGEKPTASAVLSFLCYFEGVETPIVINFSKTSYKAGKQLLSLAKYANCDMFRRAYKLKSVREESPEGAYMVFKVVPDGQATEEEYQLCEAWYEDLNHRKEEIQTVEEEEVSAAKEDSRTF